MMSGPELPEEYNDFVRAIKLLGILTVVLSLFIVFLEIVNNQEKSRSLNQQLVYGFLVAKVDMIQLQCAFMDGGVLAYKEEGDNIFSQAYSLALKANNVKFGSQEERDAEIYKVKDCETFYHYVPTSTIKMSQDVVTRSEANAVVAENWKFLFLVFLVLIQVSVINMTYRLERTRIRN